MDPILNPLLNAGIPGAMAAAFIYFCWHVVTKTLPEQRGEFLAALKEQRAECAAERGRDREAHERIAAQLSQALDGLSGEVRSMRQARP